MNIGRKEFIMGVGALFTSQVVGRPIRSILGARRLYEESSPVPYASKVAYLESTGKQWIDTGILGNSSTDSLDVLVDFMCTSSTLGFVFGSRSGPVERFGLISMANGSQFDLGYRYDLLFGQCKGGEYYSSHTLFSQTRSSCRVNSYTREYGPYTNPLDTNLSMYLFSRHGLDGANQSFTGRIFSCSIFIGGYAVRDFIPVRYTNENEEEEGIMYDRITGEFFKNQGTGHFIIGPDVV